MRLQLFRYYLTPVQSTLYNSEKTNESKSNVMKKVLAEKYDFQSIASDYGYRPKNVYGDHFVWAAVGKKAFIDHDLKENDSFIRVKEEEWPYRNVIFDITEDQQIVAFEIYRVNQFRNSVYVLKCFSDAVNKSLNEYGWTINFEPIIDTQVFWNLIDLHQGEIKSIKFSLYVPNLFGTNDSLNKELEEAKQNYSAQRVDTELVNENGNLKVPKTPFMEEGVDLIRKGGGSYVVTLRNKTRHTSESEAKYVTVSEAEVKLESEEAVIELLSKVFSIKS